MLLRAQTNVPRRTEYSAYTRPKQRTRIRSPRHPDPVRPPCGLPTAQAKHICLSASQSAAVTDSGALCVLFLCWCRLPTALGKAPCAMDCRRQWRRCLVRLDSVRVRTADGAGSGALSVRQGDCRRHRQRGPARSVFVLVRTANGSGNGALVVRGVTADGPGRGALNVRTPFWCALL